MDWGTMESVVNKLEGLEGVNLLLEGNSKLKIISRVYRISCESSFINSFKNFNWTIYSSEEEALDEDEKFKFGEEKEVVLFHFSEKTIKFESVIKEMESERCRPATFKELLVLIDQFQDLKRKSIMALGSPKLQSSSLSPKYPFYFSASKALGIGYFSPFFLYAAVKL